MTTPLVIIPDTEAEHTEMQYRDLLETLNAVNQNGSMEVWDDDEFQAMLDRVDSVNDKAETLIEQATQALKKLSRQ